MKKREREALRLRAEARQQSARQTEREANEKKRALESAALNVLSSSGVTWDDRQIEALEPGPRALIRCLIKGSGRRLVCRETREALVRLGTVVHQRSVSEWRPQGKGRDTLLRSLCEHLLAKYPTPRFLWSAFEDHQNAAVLVPLVVHVAAGGSLFHFCKEGFPVALTRAQCREFISSSGDMTVISALRRVQIKAEGGTQALFEVWRNLERMKVLGTKAEEDFKITVLRLFARNPMLNRAQIGPLCDFICHRVRENPAFSMQGRTIASLTRGMNEWHDELNQARFPRFNTWRKARDEPAVKFPRSGFQGYRIERPLGKATRTGFTRTATWTIEEILSSENLRLEGQALRHCVYTYRFDVASGGTSIWSLAVKEDRGDTQRILTLEVNNKTQSVVQARGACNRMPKPEEERLIAAWASRNALNVTYGRGW